jgi:hypothetical protein
MWILQWFTSRAFCPTLFLPLHLNSDIPLYEWTSVSFIHGLTKITTIEMIMLLWKVYKVVIFKNLSWFLICLGWSFSPPLPLLSKSHIASHCGIEKCPNKLWRNFGPSWFIFLGFHTIGIIFLLKSKDRDKKPKSFPFQQNGFETHYSNSLVLHSYSSFVWHWSMI